MSNLKLANEKLAISGLEIEIEENQASDADEHYVLLEWHDAGFDVHGRSYNLDDLVDKARSLYTSRLYTKIEKQSKDLIKSLRELNDFNNNK